MAPKVNLKDNHSLFKGTRISVVSIAGSLLGAGVAGAIGGPAGLTLGVATAVGVAISQVDGF